MSYVRGFTVPSCSHGMARTEIPPIHDEWSSVPIHMPPIRLSYLRSGIYYQVAATSGPASAALRCQALPQDVYLDDWLTRASAPLQARTHTDLFLWVLQHHGGDAWCINTCSCIFQHGGRPKRWVNKARVDRRQMLIVIKYIHGVFGGFESWILRQDA